MDVHHALGALGEDRALELQQLDLRLEHHRALHGVVTGAEHITLENFILVQIANLQLHIVTWSAIGHLLLLVVHDVQYLAWQVSWGKGQAITKAHGALFDFTEDDRTVAVLHLVQDGDAERCICVPLLHGHIIEDVEKGRPRVPIANRAVDRLDNVLTSQSGNGHPEEVIGGVAALLQEWNKVGLDVLPACLLPADSGLVHLIHDNNQLADAE